jgi:class 3 adenylate cyclase
MCERGRVVPRRKKKVQKDAQPKPGGDPTRERETVVMFVDIMGASEVSNHKSSEAYANFVQSFQRLFNKTCESYINEWCTEYKEYVQYSSRGDEGLLMLYRESDPSNTSIDIDIAINIALELKRKWLFNDENIKRIEDGLLPIDLAVGIHIGKTFLTQNKSRDDNSVGWKPEGYAINLAKRVEGHSRQGRSSHIFLSEAAYGNWNSLPDERIYFFDQPVAVSPKGISREIRVYELKHHFLPSDWKDLSESSERVKTFLDSKFIDMEIMKRAVNINPTNLWLNEEFIRSSMLVNYNNLEENKRNENEALKKCFEPAWQRADLLAQSEQRDVGILCIQGLIEGEYGKYIAERGRYDAAIKLPDQLPEANWYKGQSLSYEVYEGLNYDADVAKDKIKIKELVPLIDEALECFKLAKEGRFQAAWMRYDYGCEIVRWAKNKQELFTGIDEVVGACSMLPDVRYSIQTEPYLRKVLSNPRIKMELERIS